MSSERLDNIKCFIDEEHCRENNSESDLVYLLDYFIETRNAILAAKTKLVELQAMSESDKCRPEIQNILNLLSDVTDTRN